MNKTYIVLLSSLIACSSRAMLYDGMSPRQKEDCECMGRADVFDTVCAVEKNIGDDVRVLPKDSLTEDGVLAVINNALKPYESNPAVADTLQTRCKWIHKIASWHHEIIPDNLRVALNAQNMPYRVRRFDINEDQSRIALLLGLGCGKPKSQQIEVYEESGRGKKWNTIYQMTPDIKEGEVAYMRFIDKGKKLVYFRSMGYPPVRIVTHDVIDIDGGQSSASGALHIDADQISARAALQKEIEEKSRFFNSKEYSLDDDRLYLDSVSRGRSTDSRAIQIRDVGFNVDYQPTLREIASFLVSKRLETLRSPEDTK